MSALAKGAWDVASLGEEQGLERGSYIVDDRGNVLARVLDDEAENLLAAGPELLEAIKAAPHTAGCGAVSEPAGKTRRKLLPHTIEQLCDCWKSVAIKKAGVGHAA